MPTAAIPGSLTTFQECLIGTWKNQALPNGEAGAGGPENPFGYSVMPLPQRTGAVEGYILKNSTVNEVITFNSGTANPPPTSAANRGQGVLQAATALYYEQIVSFADGPGSKADPPIVHTENGSWLNLPSAVPFEGPYPAPPGIQLTVPNQQPPYWAIAKQMSVPHGNSILAVGSYGGPSEGVPLAAYPPQLSVLPQPAGLDVTPYYTVLADEDNYQNPIPEWTLDPVAPLRSAIELIEPTNTIYWNVTTAACLPGAVGGVLNVPFEQRNADVTDYSAYYWLFSTDDGKSYPYLAYLQIISMVLTIGGARYSFPHVTCNVITKQRASRRKSS